MKNNGSCESGSLVDDKNQEIWEWGRFIIFQNHLMSARFVALSILGWLQVFLWIACVYKKKVSNN